jgi:hypothetical protein
MRDRRRLWLAVCLTCTAYEISRETEDPSHIIVYDMLLSFSLARPALPQTRLASAEASILHYFGEAAGINLCRIILDIRHFYSGIDVDIQHSCCACKGALDSERPSSTAAQVKNGQCDALGLHRRVPSRCCCRKARAIRQVHLIWSERMLPALPARFVFFVYSMADPADVRLRSG